MAWWSWIIAGAILLGAELAFVNAQFYLVFIGSASLVVGLITASTELAPWIQWALFAVLALLSMVLFRSRVYEKFHDRLPTVRTGPVGGVMTLPAALPVGESCQAEYGGAFWSVCNASGAAIPSGTRVRITSVRNLTLLVTPDT